MITLYHTATIVYILSCGMWLNLAGPAKLLVLDIGTHNRGIFAGTINAMGIQLRYMGAI